MTAITKPPKTRRGRKKSAAEEMAALRAAAEASTVNDVSLFVQAYEQIDWQKQTADNIAEAVQLALNTGVHFVAHELAMLGAARYPKHPELQKMGRILAPPKVTVLDIPPDTTWRHNREWLEAHWDEYRGKWVALRSGQLLNAADSFKDLIAYVGNTRNTDILVMPIW
jgi:hypothetical protein